LSFTSCFPTIPMFKLFFQVSSVFFSIFFLLNRKYMDFLPISFLCFQSAMVFLSPIPTANNELSSNSPQILVQNDIHDILSLTSYFPLIGILSWFFKYRARFYLYFYSKYKFYIFFHQIFSNVLNLQLFFFSILVANNELTNNSL